MQRFLKECSLFFVFLALINFYILERPLYYLLSFPELEELKEAIDDEVDIILFGSSVNRYTAFQDTNKSSIGEMLDLEMVDVKVKDISHGAYHVEIFYSFLKRILKYEYQPKIVLPINLRSFSPEWDLRPGYQFTREKNILEFGLLYPFLSDYEDIDITDFNTFPIYRGDSI